jgi:hypothetical protein
MQTRRSSGRIFLGKAYADEPKLHDEEEADDSVLSAGRAIKDLANPLKGGSDFKAVATVKQVLKTTLEPARVNQLLGKQMNAHITEKDWSDLAMKITEAAKSDDFEGTLAQVFQPKGGSENFTNLRSPGSPAGKISADGNDKLSASNIKGRIPKFKPLDVSGEFSESENAKQPPYALNSKTSGVPDPKVYTYDKEGRIFSDSGTTTPGEAHTNYKSTGPSLIKAFGKKNLGDHKDDSRSQELER